MQPKHQVNLIPLIPAQNLLTHTIINLIFIPILPIGRFLPRSLTVTLTLSLTPNEPVSSFCWYQPSPYPILTMILSSLLSPPDSPNNTLLSYQQSTGQPMSETTLIADQLIVVTTRSFHVFQLSGIPNRSDFVDQLVSRSLSLVCG